MLTNVPNIQISSKISKLSRNFQADTKDLLLEVDLR